MIIAVQPSTVTGTIQAPASKSAMQRACAAALIRKGTTIIQNPGRSNDDKAALDVIQQLGATITDNNSEIIIHSNGVNPVAAQLNCGESGLGIRMFTPIAATAAQPIEITGTGSLVTRPMDFFDTVLPQLGVNVQSNEGKLPLHITGPLQPNTITVDGSLSSQFLTGLLMAYAAAGASNVTLYVTDLKSRPYIDLTLQFMQLFGLKLPVNNHYESFYFDDAPVNYAATPLTYSVEGDWSGGAFLLVAGAIAGNVQVKGLSKDSTQADKKILEALEHSGAAITYGDGYITVAKNKLHSFEFDATDCPDLFPPLVALAANCTGITRIKGLKRLKHKESDRGLTLQEEFAKLGTTIDLDDDVMSVRGTGSITVQDHVLYSHHDHRIAMANAVACLTADREVIIKNADAVKKSYPDFWDHMKALNAGISLKPFTTDNTYRL